MQGEVKLKELPFPALLLQTWPMTKNTIPFFPLSLQPQPDSWKLYGWNVMLGSFTFLNTFPQSTAVAGSKHWTAENLFLTTNVWVFLPPWCFLELIPLSRNKLPHLAFKVARFFLCQLNGVPLPPPHLALHPSISGNNTFSWIWSFEDSNNCMLHLKIQNSRWHLHESLVICP